MATRIAGTHFEAETVNVKSWHCTHCKKDQRGPMVCITDAGYDVAQMCVPCFGKIEGFVEREEK